MNSERTWTWGPANTFGFKTRALNPSPTFWLAMFVASAFGTVLGDFWAQGLHLGLVLSFGTLVVITGLLIWGDTLKGQGTEVFYWLAIIFLRAGATNVGDGLIHIVGLSFIVASLLAAVATRAAGFVTLSPSAGATSPLIDLRYWLCDGDWRRVRHCLRRSCIAYDRDVSGPDRTRHLSYCGNPCPRRFGSDLDGRLLVHRPRRTCGGDPPGDWFASRRGLGLGLPVALLCVGAGLIAALWLYQRTKRLL